MKRLSWLLIASLLACNSESSKEYPKWTEEDRAYLISEFQATQQVIHDLVDDLSYEQWHFKSDENSWSISYVIEHLQLQEDMHYREVRIVSMQPPRPEYSLRTIDNDSKVEGYATSPQKGTADWNVTPLGRWPTKQLSMMAFDRSRDKMIELVREMKADLRQQVTFRNISDESDFRSVRNLHQILLTTIAHTKRHTIQIRNILAHPNFPK